MIKLGLDVTDPQTRSRVEKQWAAVYALRRAVQRDARARVDAFWAAPCERATDGPRAVQDRLGLTRKGLEAAASGHVDASRWMRAHVTKALALHVADEVWETVNRHLFPDRSGKRAGRPRVGGWFDFTRIPGRAKSHTKEAPVWETWRLAGSLQGHLDTYGTHPGLTVAEAVLVDRGASLLTQPKRMRVPVPPVKNGRADWWGFDGPLTVVFSGLPAGDLVLPVRLPQGSGTFPRLAHFLADPTVWHKIDLVRVQDRHAPGGWRYYAHLLVLAAGYQAESTLARRAGVPTGRVAGVDGNVSSIAVVSMPANVTEAADAAGVTVTYLSATPEQRAAAARAAKRARDRQRALDRSRRNANRDQYTPSVRQVERAARRASAGLTPRIVDTPTGARVANTAGIPTRAYRKDTLSQSYRRTRADHAADARAASQAKRARAAEFAQQIITTHGSTFTVEHVSMAAWARQWGRGIALFSPGMLVTALDHEARATGGTLTRAGTVQTALSQHCLCGRREKKPLSQRTHVCPACGLVADRDVLAAANAACVTLTHPYDPRTARVDPELHAALQRRVAAQQEALHRPTAASPPAHPSRRVGHGSHDGVVTSTGEPSPHPALPRNRHPVPSPEQADPARTHPLRVNS